MIRFSVLLACQIAYRTRTHKLVYVATFLVCLALGILAQAPDGGAPAGKTVTGPDAVPANLVNTVCASCRLLDRVINRRRIVTHGPPQSLA